VPAVFEFRVTKYDPALRDAQGAFTGDEWTSFDDIGESFSGVPLTEDGYYRVEDAYVAVATSFMRETGVPTLSVAGLESNTGTPLPFNDAAALGPEAFGAVVRQLLRGEFRCRLESAGGFIHVGWDYYMYVGARRPCPSASAEARRLGLFVEPFRSPYRERSDA
jgi:hypothetical protein